MKESSTFFKKTKKTLDKIKESLSPRKKNIKLEMGKNSPAVIIIDTKGEEEFSSSRFISENLKTNA
jgi:hypothetical protein